MQVDLTNNDINDSEGEYQDRTEINLKVHHSAEEGGTAHLSVDAAYEFLDGDYRIIDKIKWLTMGEAARRDFARHWYHMDRASRLDLLEMGNVNLTCDQTSWMIRALMTLCWEAEAGNHDAAKTIDKLWGKILKQTPDFYQLI